MPPIRLASQIGTQAFTVWRLADGTFQRTPMSLGAYRALALPNAGPPERPPGVPVDAVWERSYEKFLLDTPSGEQEDGVRFGDILWYDDTPGLSARPWELSDVDLEDNAPGRRGEHTGQGANITLARDPAPGIRIAGGQVLRTGPPT